MKWILIIVIRSYWKFLPKRIRRSCLFKETCSQYVYKQTVEYGFFGGMRALENRIRKCRKGYTIYNGKNGFEMKLADGSIIYEEEISPNLLKPIYNQVDIITDQLNKKTCP